MFTKFTKFTCPLFASIYVVNIGVNFARKFTIRKFTTFGHWRRVNFGMVNVWAMFTTKFTL